MTQPYIIGCNALPEACMDEEEYGLTDLKLSIYLQIIISLSLF